MQLGESDPTTSTTTMTDARAERDTNISPRRKRKRSNAVLIRVGERPKKALRAHRRGSSPIAPQLTAADAYASDEVEAIETTFDVATMQEATTEQG
jgi:hypothetical protein